jgi:outer membrane protein OmpU
VTGKNGFSVGANFVDSFESIDIAAAAGFRTADEVPTVGNDGEDFEQYSAGLNVGFSGFTVGGSVAWEDSDFATGGIAWDAGASYASGPWAFGVTFLHTEVSGLPGISGDDEQTAIEGGVSYKIGPGITGRAAILWVDWEPQFGEGVSGLQGIFGVSFRY